MSRTRNLSPAELAIASRIRTLRKDMRVSQMKLAEALGVGYQQVQKYETGQNRISAGTLAEIAKRLNIPVAYFFDEVRVDSQTPCSPISSLSTRCVDRKVA